MNDLEISYKYTFSAKYMHNLIQLYDTLNNTNYTTHSVSYLKKFQSHAASRPLTIKYRYNIQFQSHQQYLSV